MSWREKSKASPANIHHGQRTRVSMRQAENNSDDPVPDVIVDEHAQCTSRGLVVADKKQGDEYQTTCC